MADKEQNEENNKNPEQTHLADSQGKKSSSNSAGDQNKNFATGAESKYLATAMGAFRQNPGENDENDEH